MCLALPQCRADMILPAGLAPGSQYEIAFVTSDGTTATSPDITDYNNFVTREANQDAILAGLGVTWHAIASTDAVTANLNAPSSGTIPIYNTAGLLVADASSPLYSGQLLNPIDFDQYGNGGRPS